MQIQTLESMPAAEPGLLAAPLRAERGTTVFGLFTIIALANLVAIALIVWSVLS